ncbi:hypothetical protein RMSM_01528 [Rhodopirellula maiorica SM1]|uniref:Uncharacterized protein n=1 Tax=Rhodopirellula maiorica SM1 TaxID=1265738 RepID=M5S5S1_9BACT|nr:hypothetical protein RMSM_01528 [Rhodopirellula maiorica SM1]
MKQPQFEATIAELAEDPSGIGSIYRVQLQAIPRPGDLIEL